MLSYQKNKLINLILQFEISFNNAVNDFMAIPVGTWTNARDEYAKVVQRNLISIKKQINKL